MQALLSRERGGWGMLWVATVLALGLGLQRYAWAPAALLAVVLQLRLVRLACTPVRAWAAVFAAQAVAVLWVADDAYLQAPTGLRVGIDLGVAVLSTLPYLAHRLLAPSMPVAWAWLPFASAQVVLEAASARGPYGSWGAMAYSWVDVDALMQWSAIGGTAAVAVIVCAVAVLVEGIWQQGGLAAARGRVLALVLLLAVVAGVGEWRLGQEMPGERLRVAAVALSDADYRGVVAGRSMRALAMAGPADRAQAGVAFASAHRQLLAQTESALRQGARLVVWAETVPTLAEQLPDLLARLESLAREHEAEILATPWVVLATPQFPYGRNTAIGIDAGGARFEFDKGHPVPGLESNIRPGGRPPQSWDTQAGSATVAICMDFDFPGYIRMTAGARPGWLLAPADDWPQVEVVHAAMHRLRAIENGSGLVRAAHNGQSLLADAQGRVVASARSDRPVVLVGDLPRAGVATFYARFGDWLEILCGLALLACSLGARWRGAHA